MSIDIYMYNIYFYHNPFLNCSWKRGQLGLIPNLQTLIWHDIIKHTLITSFPKSYNSQLK